MAGIRRGDKLEIKTELVLRFFNAELMSRKEVNRIAAIGCSMITVEEEFYRNYYQNVRLSYG